jgi:hypothetical protein
MSASAVRTPFRLAHTQFHNLQGNLKFDLNLIHPSRLVFNDHSTPSMALGPGPEGPRSSFTGNKLGWITCV